MKHDMPVTFCMHGTDKAYTCGQCSYDELTRLRAEKAMLVEALERIEKRTKAGDLDEWSIKALGDAASEALAKVKP